ncbi:putative Maternal embryonic leucine zipper kinase [Blattamonas nauphoetae]|uniref:Maternal embryonic leucine zipper kinase n=1 Tax=Blattamonas nauphoetae TaxID=2049346 RepID=A0ABQ9XFR2_9EUKA|nr:putative Maternal embryonic leucine zipper kinase [Blattamonas nauphoetae]
MDPYSPSSISLSWEDLPPETEVENTRLINQQNVLNPSCLLFVGPKHPDLPKKRTLSYRYKTSNQFLRLTIFRTSSEKNHFTITQDHFLMMFVSSVIGAHSRYFYLNPETPLSLSALFVNLETMAVHVEGHLIPLTSDIHAIQTGMMPFAVGFVDLFQTIMTKYENGRITKFVDVLSDLSSESSDSIRDLTFLSKPCFSSTLKKITKRCQRVLNEPDTPPTLPLTSNEQHSPSSLVFREVSHLSSTLLKSTLDSSQNPAPSSFGNITIKTLESEDTHLSTQMPSPPSRDSDFDIEITSESTLSPSEDSKQTCLHLLEMMEDLRRRRTEEPEEEWDLLQFHLGVDGPDMDLESLFEELEEHEIENDGLDFPNLDESSEDYFQKLVQSPSLFEKGIRMMKIFMEELDGPYLEILKPMFEQVFPGTETSDQQLTLPTWMEQYSRRFARLMANDEKTRLDEDHARSSRPHGGLDETVYDLIDDSSLLVHVLQSEKMFAERKNLDHLHVTPRYVENLAQFLLSDRVLARQMSKTQLCRLLESGSEANLVCRTLFPLLRRSFFGSNEEACFVLTCVLAQALNLELYDTLIRSNWTDADWIALFSHRWTLLQDLIPASVFILAILLHLTTNHYNLSVSTASLLRSFNQANTFVDRFSSLRIGCHLLDPPFMNVQFLAILSLACCGAENKKIPAAVNAALFEGELSSDIHTLILNLLSHINIFELDGAQFLASFPVEFILEKLFIEILSKQPDNVVLNPSLNNSLLFIPNTVPFLVSLHPYVIRGLGSILLHYSLIDLSLHNPKSTSEVDTTNAFSSLLWNKLCIVIESPLTIPCSLFLFCPSTQIVEMTATFFNSIVVVCRNDVALKKVLPSLWEAVCASINIASLSSLLHLLNSLRRLTKRFKHLDSVSLPEVWATFRVCLTQLRFHLPPFAFITLFEADETECSKHLLDYQLSEKRILKRNISDLNQFTRSLYLHDTSVAFSVNEETLQTILFCLLSSIPAFRSTAFVILSKLCTSDNVEMVLDLCRLGVVECVMKADLLIKVLLYGDSDVGKTALFDRFLTGNFPESTAGTMGVDFGNKTIQIDAQTIKLQLVSSSEFTIFFCDERADNDIELYLIRDILQKLGLPPERTPSPEPVPSPEPQLSWWSRRRTRRQTEDSQATHLPPHLATQSHAAPQTHDAPRPLSLAVPSDTSGSTKPQTEHTLLHPPQRKKGSEISVPDYYIFIRPINSGGFGTVVEMEDKRTKERVAGKMIQCLTDKQSERIAREVGRLKRYRHAGIVSVKKIEEMENMGVIVMELGERSVGDLVKECKARDSLVPREIVYRIMVEISSALCFMHNHPTERGSHGDVKLENILLFEHSHAKLCDLGAMESEDVSSSLSVMTHLYVSPERLTSETGRATPESDVWSLGIVLHWLLFGEPPFKSQTAARLIQEIGSFKATDIGNSCGEEERNLLMRILDPDPVSRLTSKQLSQSTLFRCLLNMKEAFWRLFDQNEKELLEERRRTIGKSDNTLAALPSLIFTKQTHFSTNCTTLTRTDVGGDRDGDGRTSSVLIADTFSSGVISVSLTVLSLPLGKASRGDICFGLMDAASAIPRIDEKLGTTVRSSVCVDSFGSVWTYTSTSHPSRLCLSRLNEDDTFRMEVDLDSNPRKVQFFKNGESGKCFVSHLPRSVKIGFSVTIQGTSFRVENVARLSQPTTLVDGIAELVW